MIWRRTTVVLAVMAAMVLALPAMGGGRPLTADLAAENEVGPAAPGDPGTTGFAFLTLNQGQGEICFDIDVEGQETRIVAAHIHVGEADVNGPVVVDFRWDSTAGSGCVDDIDKGLIKDIRQNPDDYYVNVHNAVAPGGAARGQLSK